MDDCILYSKELLVYRFMSGSPDLQSATQYHSFIDALIPSGRQFTFFAARCFGYLDAPASDGIFPK
jgi:hypothetical protein